MLRILLFLFYPAFATTAPATSNDAWHLECGPGWNYDPVGRACYKIHRDIAANWEKARTKCIEDGGNLASIHNSHEQNYVSKLVENIDSEMRLWIGAFNADHNDGWQYSDCTLFDYSNWSEGEPNNSGSLNEWCAEMFPENGQWNDAVCGERKHFLCKKPSTTPVELPVSSNNCRPECGPGWNYYDSSGRTCYKMDLDSLASWYEARVRCTADGGDLASVNGDEEQNYIAKLLEIIHDGNRIWIGAYYTNRWQWNDGTSLIYTHWLEDEPNNHDGNELCVEMHPNAGWNDEKCNKSFNFLCEKPSASPPPAASFILPMSTNNLKGHKINSAIISAILNIKELLRRNV